MVDMKNITEAQRRHRLKYEDDTPEVLAEKYARLAVSNARRNAEAGATNPNHPDYRHPTALLFNR